MPQSITQRMPEIIIDEELKNLLPILPRKTYDNLEESLLEHGCIHPLILWGNILIDGHNRFELASKHSIPFTYITKEFSGRDDVIIWIITTQIARRNLNSSQLSYYRGLHYKTEKKIISNENGNNQYNVVGDQNDHQPRGEKTALRLAKQYHVSEPTIRRDEKFADAINAIGESSPEAKRNILSGMAGITRKHLRELMGGDEEQLVEMAKKIEDGTFERPKPVRTKPVTEGDSESQNTHNPNASDAVTHPMRAVIFKETEDFSVVLQKITNDSNALQLKTTLRSHIDILESLYMQL